MKRPGIMKRIFIMMIGAGLMLFPSISKGAQDLYSGDTEIYGSTSAATFAPNVLFLIDDSGSMKDPPPNSPPDYVYTQTYGVESVCTALSIKDLPVFAAAGGPLLVAPPGLNENSESENGKTASDVLPRLHSTDSGNRVSENIVPQVLPSVTNRDGGPNSSKAVKASWKSESLVFVAASAVWNGIAPEFLRAASCSPNCSISGTIQTSSNNPLSGVAVQISGNSQIYNTTTDSSGNYSVSGLSGSGGGISYTITPSLSGYTFTFTGSGNNPTNITTSNKTGKDFTGDLTCGGNYCISGTITTASSPLSGVAVQIVGNSQTYNTTTDSNGNYIKSGLSGSGGGINYTITPSKSGYYFTSSSLNTSITNQNKTGKDFTATPTCGSSCSITGTITTSGGSPVSGVTVTVKSSGGTVVASPQTDSSGVYTATGLAGSSGGTDYTLTPTLSGYSFSCGGGCSIPRTVTITTSNVTGKNFTATASCGSNCSVSGNINTGGGSSTPVSGVTVTVVNSGGTIAGSGTTDSSGNYTVTGLTGGGAQYSITPTKSGYTFSCGGGCNMPMSVTINNSNLTGKDFRATVSVSTPHYISGTIQIVGTNNGISGLVVTATDSSGNVYSDTTSSTGFYKIINVPDGTYAIMETDPSNNYTNFTPVSPFTGTVVLTGANSQGNNIDATFSGTYQISGTIDTGGRNANPISGVTVTITGNGQTYTATTNNQGRYTVSGLTGNGVTYTVTPTLSGYAFNPTSSSVTINSSNRTADFTGSNGSGGSGGGSKINCVTQNIYKFTSTSGTSSSGTYNTWGSVNSNLQINCPPAYAALYAGSTDPSTGIFTPPSGVWVGTLNSTTGACSATDQAGTFFYGNWLNWANQTVANASGSSKMTIAINTVKSLIATNTNLRMGMMTFDNNSKGGTFVKSPTDATYTSYISDPTTSNIANLQAAVGSLTAHTYTPLGGALYEAMLYYMGKPSWVTPALNYQSPIEAECQTNFVIVVTDGMSTSDTAMVPTHNTGFGQYCDYGDCDGDKSGNNNEMQILGMDPGSGSDYMDDVAYFMHTRDLLDYATFGSNSTVNGSNVSYTVAGNQGASKVTTYTIGFALDPADLTDLQGIKLLTDTANNGGGKFVNVMNSASLMSELSAILGSIIQTNTSFVAPVVPVSPTNRTYSGNSVYIGLFRPETGGNWEGNLKKYGYVNNQVVDMNGAPATATTGAINTTAQSYWSTQADGGLVKEGGVGTVLYNQVKTNISAFPYGRTTYSYLSSITYPNSGTTTHPIITSSNQFNATNISPATLGFSSSDTFSQTRLINYIYGLDSYGSTPTNERTWLLGDILHSQPAVVNYSAANYYDTNTAGYTNCAYSLIFVGSNDGMLHAFQDTDPINAGGSCYALTNNGQELWAFIPPDLLGNLSNLPSGTQHGYYVDSSPAVYFYDANADGNIRTGTAGCVTGSTTNCDKVILVFGERRGGTRYYALDITDPNNPQMLWKADPNMTDGTGTTVFPDLGESWSQPQIVPVNLGGTTVTQVAFISGGYDNTKEDLNITPPYSYIDSAGRAVYAIDLLTGTNLWEYSYRSSVTNDSTNSKFNMTYSIPSDLTAVDVNNNGTVDTLYVGDVGGQIWEFNVGYSSTSSWSGTVIFQSNPGADSSSGRKFFYPPDLSIESGYRALFAGTGDREHPKTSTSVVDRLYAIYDKSSYTAISKEGGTAPSSTNANPLLMDVTTNLTPTITGAGWYIRLNGTGTMLGEKSLSAPLLLNKEVTYTTYAPLLPSMSANACGTALGTGFVWSLNYANGNAFFDYNKDGTKDLSDRSKSLGSGIPSGVVVTVTQSGMSGLVGIGGGIEGVDLNTGASFNQIFWHQPY